MEVRLYPLFDHDDFAKSRKALMATSAFLLILSRMSIVGDSVQFSGLTFKIDLGLLRSFASIFLIYFLYVFIIRSFQLLFERNLERTKANITEIMKELKEVGEDEFINSKRKDDFVKAVNTKMVRINAMSELSKLGSIIFVEVFPALAFAAYTTSSTGALENAIKLLRS